MLTHIIEHFSAPPKCVNEVRELILDYHKFMISEGFLGQKYDIFVESEEAGCILAGGVLTHGDFPPKGLELAGTSRKSCNRLLAKREDIIELANEIDVQVFNVSHSQDDHYCNHNSWRGLVLTNAWPMGITPILCCDCGGLVARYRVPFSGKTGTDVWGWDVGSYSVEACWSASGVLEAWGNDERHDPLSRLNAFGLSIVKRIQSETGIDSWLYIPARASTMVTTCPLCEGDMSSLDSPSFWNYGCDRCRIVTGLDVTM